MLKQLVVSARQKLMTEELSRMVKEKVAKEQRLWKAKRRTPKEKPATP
jgi:hypothetical protein